MNNHRTKNPALRIALTYLLAGYLWILVSDAAVFMVPERHLRVLLQASKGWLFVTVTAALLYILIKRYLTQQEKSVQDLAAKEERLSLALASSRTGVWEWDLRTDRVVWSPEVYGIVGLPGFDGTFPSFVPLVHPDDLERVMANVQQALAARGDYTDEFRIIRPDTGETRWLKNRGKGYYDADGVPIILMGTVQDITERKQYQNALQTSEERMKLLLQGVKIGIWDWDLQSGLAYLSPEYYEIAEYAPESIVPDLAFFKSLVHPDDLARVMAVMEAHMRNETEGSNADFRIITGNGTVKWISSRGKVLRRDQSGAPLRMAGTMVDVSGHRLAVDRFEQFFSTISDLACIASPDGYFLKINKVWSATLGYSDEELLAMPYLDLIHPDDRLATREVANHADDKTVANFAKRYRCKDGTYRWLEWTATPSASESLIFATARDITDRRQSELQLMESEVRFSTIFHTNPVACGISSMESNRFIDVNDAFLALFGYERSEVIGHTSLELGLWPYPAERELLLAQLAEQGRVTQYEAHYRHRSGRIGSLLISVESIILDGRHVMMGLLVDISRRKETEQELLANEERYRAVVEDQTEVICRFTMDGTFLFANDAYCRMFGLLHDEVIGRRWQPAVHPDDLPCVESELARMSAESPVVVIENRVYDARGELRWMQFVNRGLYNEAGVLREIQAVGRDITDRKQIEQELVRSEEQFFKAFDRCPFLMAISTLDEGRYIAVNDMFLSTLGLQRENVIGRTSRELNLFDDYRQRDYIVNQLREKDFVAGCEVKVRKPSGEVITGLFSAEMIVLQNKSCLLTTFNDISELKLKEAALRESEERYRRLFEVESDAVMVIDNATGKFVDANSAALALYGYTLDELYHLGPANVSAEPEKTMEAINLRDRFVPLRYHRKKDGTVFPVELAASFFEYQGRSLYVAAIRDITERQQYETHLLELNKNLHTLSEHLQVVQEQERLAIARDIHDDIGQQLTALKLDIDWLEHQLSPRASRLGDRIDGMRTGIELLIARVQQIASDLRPPLLDNLGLVAAIEWQVGEFTRRTGIECILMLNEDAEPDDLQIATSLVRIVQEALTNVSRHARASEVSLSLCRTGGGILLEVTDNGCGIREEDLAALDSYGVLGMQERAHLCGGELQISGVPGGGTRLRLTIPYVRKEGT